MGIMDMDFLKVIYEKVPCVPLVGREVPPD